MAKRNKNRSFYLAIAVLGILALAGGAFAYSAIQNINVSGDYNYYEAEGQPSGQAADVSGEEFGAISGDDIYGNFFFHDQVLAGFAINQPIAVPPTSTKNVFTGGRDLRASVASWTNTTGKKLVCSSVRMPILTSSDTWTFSYGVGTTTKITASPSWTNTTTATLIASTTAANTADIVADNFNLFTSKGNPGSYFTLSNYGVPTSTEFFLDNGVSIVGWIKTIDATSTDSFVKNSGHRLTGGLEADCQPIKY